MEVLSFNTSAAVFIMVKVCGHVKPPFFTKGNKFRDFLFAFLANIALLNGVYS